MWLLIFACAHGPIRDDIEIEVPERDHLGKLADPASVADATLAAILQRAQQDQRAWDTLSELCDGIGARLAGSDALAEAVSWAVAELADAKLEKVWTEEVAVPVWVRGSESLTMLAPVQRPMAMLGLGGSIGTDGIEAPVSVVQSFEALGPDVAGRIVLFDVPMLEGTPTVERYGPAVQYRTQGASQAAAHGAVATLVRSVTTRSLYTPHTGAMRYDPDQPQIPAAAITTEDADSIARLVRRGEEVQVRLEMGAKTLPDAKSHNVLAEITGRTHPEEIVVIGAHLDSWDVGQGAHDDGSGVVEVIEAMRVIRALGVRPHRTIRAVLFTNEENGLRGGIGYAAAHTEESGDIHVAAVETDLGGGRPLRWGATGSKRDMAWLRRAVDPLGMPVDSGGGGADISPLGERGTLVIGLRPDDSHYFDVHHTQADTLDKVDPVALAEATAAVAGIAWQLANSER